MYKYFRVPDQPIESVGSPLFGTVETTVGDNGHCPNSLATDNRRNSWGGYYCYSEEEMIQNFISKKSAQTACAWNRCSYHSFSVVGGYASPYDYIRGNWASRTGWMWWRYPGNKSVNYQETNLSYGGTTNRSLSLLRLQPFSCPAGTHPFDTDDRTLYPRLCKSTVRPHIKITKLRQENSCAVNDNPCHPSSGDKTRAEMDFSFGGWDFTRHYHSLREFKPDSSSVGVGWTHSFSMRLVAPGADSTGIYTGKGHRERIAYVAQNRFVVPTMRNAQLEKLPDGSWRLIEQSGDISSFTSTGLRTAVFNSRNPERSLTFFNGVGGRVERAIDTAGRELQLAYGPTGLLTTATLPDGAVVSYTYDASENLVSVDYGDGQIKHYHYGEAGLATNGDANLLTGITSEDGRRYASFGYDIHGRVVLSTLFGVSGETVETTRIHYTAANQAQVTTEDGAVKVYTYSGGNHPRPLSIAGPAGVVSGTFDGFGRPGTRTDARGVQTRYGYTGNQLTAVTSAYGTAVQRTERLDWHPTLGVLLERRTIDASSTVVAKSSWTYNTRGQVLTTELADIESGSSRSTSTTYCEQADVDTGACPRVGLVTSVDGPRTDVLDVIARTYYPESDPGCGVDSSVCAYRKGDLWKITDALGHVTEILRYDGAGRPLSIKGADGIITDYEYHSRGWLSATKVRGSNSASESDDRITRLEYWPTGLVRKVIQSDGAFTTYGYDAGHRLTTIGDNDGNTITYILDGAGNRLQEDTHGADEVLRRTLSRLYNQLGQLVTEADAGYNPTDFTYDPNGNLRTVTDPLGRAMSSNYDPLNRLVRILQDVGGVEAETRFEYDALDNLTRVTDPKGLDTVYTYNAFGDLLQLDSPDTGTTTYTYDSAGNRTAQVDARGQASSYAYDALNRLTGVSYAGAADQNVTFVHDTVQPVCQADETFATGHLSAMIDASGSTHYCYDRFGQMVRKVQVTNGQTFTLRYSYTRSGQLSRLTYPDGSEADYVRDAQGRVTEVGVTSPGGSREVLLSGASYAPFGPATGWTYGNGRALVRSHDLDYRPESIFDGAPGGLDLGYSYDPVGNLSALRTADLAEPPRARFEYDALNRLTAFKDGAAGATIEGYAYDATGNRTGFTNAGGPQSYTYPADSHHLTSVAGVQRAYDSVGNTTAIGASKEFIYSAANRLSEVKQGGAVTMRYIYNGKGERVRRHLGTDDVTTLYDEAGRWLGDYDATGTPIQQAIWLDDNPVGLLVGATGINRLQYVQSDHLGTPRSVIDPIRNVAVWTWDLASEAFGASPPNQDPDNDSTNFVLDMRFPGQRYDAASGLNYNYFREYEPGTGRYSQSDPMGQAGGIATYLYVEADPLQLEDPFGLEPRNSFNAFLRRRRGDGTDMDQRLSDYYQEKTDKLVQPVSPAQAVDSLLPQGAYWCKRIVCYVQSDPMACIAGEGWIERTFTPSGITVAQVNRMPGCRCDAVRRISVQGPPTADGTDALELVNRMLRNRNRGR